MNINKEEWQEMKHVPEKNQKCKVLILKEMAYTGVCEDGNHTWQENKQGEHRFFAWKPITEEK